MTRVLREAQRPLSATEWSLAVLAKKGLPDSNRRNAFLAVRYALRNAAAPDGTIAMAEIGARTARWALREKQGAGKPGAE